MPVHVHSAAQLLHICMGLGWGCHAGHAAQVGVPGISLPLPACVLQLLRQRLESEAAALKSLQKVQEDKRLLQERLSSLQKALAQMEGEKREAERASLRLEKDKAALKKTLDKVRRTLWPLFLAWSGALAGGREGGAWPCSPWAEPHGGQ